MNSNLFIFTLTAALVVELLEYREEYENESQEGSSDTEMEDSGERDRERKEQL